MTYKTSRIGRKNGKGSSFPPSLKFWRTGSLLSRPLQPSSFNLHPSKKASSLITTLLVLVVLSTIVVAFMQSMSIERNVARSVANRFQAELAARAGAEMFRATILNAITNPITGGVAYTTWGYYPSTNEEAYYSAITVGRPNLLDDTNFLSTNNTFWLFSSPRSQSTTNISNPDQITALAAKDKVNLNNKGNIAPDQRVINVPWHEISRTTNNGQIHISRVAYWADDESSRLNLLTEQLGSGTNFQSIRKDGGHPSEIIYDQILSRTNLLQITSQLISRITRKSVLQNLETNAMAALETNSFLYTTRSFADNRIQYGPTNSGAFRRGMLRMNLNWSELTNNAISATSRVAALVGAMEQGCPEFLTTTNVLYYPSTAADFNPPSVVPSVTLNIPRSLKSTIAASIIDYLDSDFIPTQPPTMLSATNTNTPVPPVRMLNDMPRPDFFGSESAPVINEIQIVWNARPGQTTANSTVVRSGDASSGFTYTIPVLWRFELWNMSDKALPAKPYRIRSFYAQQIRASAFGLGGDSIPTQTENLFDLGTHSFSPGELKIVEVSADYVSSGPNDLGTTWSSLIKGPDGVSGNSTQNADNEPDGHVRAAYALFDGATGAWLSATTYIDGPEAPSDGSTSTGPGNKGASQGNRINDPRMSVVRNFALDTSAQAELTTVTHDGNRDWSGAGNGSIGTLNNNVNGFNYQHLGFWHDRPRIIGDGSAALTNAVISRLRNGPMASAGELGNVFDPSWFNPINRSSDSDGANSVPYRRTLRPPFKGGGSLRIGQPSGNTNFAANSWILTDVFGTSVENIAGTNYIMSTNKFLPPTSVGLLNINFPKQVIVGSFTNSPTIELFKLPFLSVTNGAGTNFAPVAVYDALKERLTRSTSISTWTAAKPFFHVGQISELPTWTNPALYLPPDTLSIFPPSSTNALRVLNRSDFEREEIFQRSIGLLSTSGSAFRIYLTGQYCTAPVSDPSKLKVLATQSLETTIVIDKKFNEGTGFLERATTYQLDSNEN